MTSNDYKAISEVLTYLSRLLVDVREDTKVLRRKVTIERSSTAQELRRLRNRIAKLEAEKFAYRDIAARLGGIIHGEVEVNPHAEKEKKKYNW